MSDTKALIKYVRDRLNDGPNITFGKPTVLDLVEALESAEASAKKAESDNAALEEDLEATEKNLKETSGFIKELLSGLKHRFPVQYADLEGDEYGDDAFSSHDLFELVIDPAVNAAQEAEAENAQLRAELKQGGVDYCALMDRHDAQFVRAEQFRAEVDWLANKTADICASVYQEAEHLHWWNPTEWKEAALRAVAAGEETCQK